MQISNNCQTLDNDACYNVMKFEDADRLTGGAMLGLVALSFIAALGGGKGKLAVHKTGEITRLRQLIRQQTASIKKMI
jgi:hypothetical protein